VIILVFFDILSLIFQFLMLSFTALDYFIFFCDNSAKIVIDMHGINDIDLNTHYSNKSLILDWYSIYLPFYLFIEQNSSLLLLLLIAWHICYFSA